MPTPWTFGRKVIRLLQERRATRRPPYTPAALARTVRCDPGAVYKWRDKGSEPTVAVALRVARTLGVPLDWLCDEGAGFPVPEASQGLLEVLKGLPARDRAELLEAMSDPTARRVALAAWRAR